MRAAIDVVSCHSQIRPDENWVPKSPRREIPNVGAGDEIIQTHLRFRAMLTCRFARRPPCRSHVPGGALIEYPPPPHTELLAFDGTEGAKLVLSEETSQNFVRGKCVPVWCYSPRSKSRTSQGTTPLLAFIPGRKGNSDLRVRRLKQRRHEPVIAGHARVSGIRPSRLFFVAQLVVKKISLS